MQSAQSVHLLPNPDPARFSLKPSQLKGLQRKLALFRLHSEANTFGMHDLPVLVKTYETLIGATITEQLAHLRLKPDELGQAISQVHEILKEIDQSGQFEKAKYMAFGALGRLLQTEHFAIGLLPVMIKIATEQLCIGTGEAFMAYVLALEKPTQAERDAELMRLHRYWVPGDAGSALLAAKS
jgi:hypothetical protein